MIPTQSAQKYDLSVTDHPRLLFYRFVKEKAVVLVVTRLVSQSSSQAAKEFVSGLLLEFCDLYAITNLSLERELTGNIDSMAHQIPFSVVLGMIFCIVLSRFFSFFSLEICR